LNFGAPAIAYGIIVPVKKLKVAFSAVQNVTFIPITYTQ